MYTDLQDLLSSPGPWATMVLPAPSSSADASERFALEQKNARRALSEDGAPGEVMDDLESALATVQHHEARAVAAYAGRDQIYVHGLPATVSPGRAAFGELPCLVPEIDQRQRWVEHVIVHLDRTGADIIASGWSEESTYSVEGSDSPVHKPQAGGWSHRRYHERAEDSWEHNAVQIADAVAAVVAEREAELVLVAGGPKMVPLVRQALPAGMDAWVTEISGSRAAGADDGSVTAEVEVATADLAARRLARTLEAVDERGLEGIDPVLEALSQGQVSTLVVADDPSDGRTAWFLPDAPVAAATASELTGLADEPVSGRLVDVAVRSALLTGAEVVVAPATRAGDLAAVMRGS